ncbi:MAG: M15 family metallopeptidase [Bacillota bacterium]
MHDNEMTRMLRLVNRRHTLDQQFIPDNLVNAVDFGISVADPAVQLQKCACIALATLTQYARTQGVGDIVLFSGYRSYEEQKRLHENKIMRLCRDGYPMPRAQIMACTVVAPPGASEHQLGLAADVTVPEYLSMKDPLIESFAQTAQGKWLGAHAHAFGFILRYPQDKTESTGVIYEPWHLRYVGAIPARRIFLGKMCLEEYLYAY